jgi:hypothetical protein
VYESLFYGWPALTSILLQYASNFEAEAESSSSTQDHTQSTPKDEDAEAGGISLLPNQRVAETHNVFESLYDDDDKTSDSPRYEDRQKDFDLKSQSSWHENDSSNGKVLPVYSPAEACPRAPPVDGIRPNHDPAELNIIHILEKKPSKDEISETRLQKIMEESLEEANVDMEPLSGPASPRKSLPYNRNHFRRRRASPIPVVDLLERAAHFKDSTDKILGRRQAEEIGKLDVPPCSLLDVSETILRNTTFVDDQEKDDMDSVFYVPPPRSSSTSTDEEDFDKRFLVLSPQMPSPSRFSEEPLMDQGPSAVLSSPSWQSKESSPNGSPKKRVRFVGDTNDELTASTGQESHVSPIETFPLCELPAFDIPDGRNKIPTSQVNFEDSVYENKTYEGVPDHTDQKMEEILPPLPCTPSRESISSSQDFTVFQDENSPCTVEEISRNLSSTVPMRSKIPVSRRSFRAKSPTKRSQGRSPRPSSPKSSPLRQPPLTLQSLNQQSSQAIESEPPGGVSLSPDEWPSLPSQKAIGTESVKTSSSILSKEKSPQPIFVAPGASKRDPEDDNQCQENTRAVIQVQPPKPGRIELYQTFFGDVEDGPDSIFD